MAHILKWTPAPLYRLNSSDYTSDKEYLHTTTNFLLNGNTTDFLRQTSILCVKAKFAMSRFKVFNQNLTVRERKGSLLMISNYLGNVCGRKLWQSFLWNIFLRIEHSNRKMHPKKYHKMNTYITTTKVKKQNLLFSLNNCFLLPPKRYQLPVILLLVHTYLGSISVPLVPWSCQKCCCVS